MFEITFNLIHAPDLHSPSSSFDFNETKTKKKLERDYRTQYFSIHCIFFLEICKTFTLLYSVDMIYAIKFYGEKVNKWKLFKCDKESIA